MTNPNHVPWKCGACDARGVLPRLDDVSLADTMAAIATSHERKSRPCHHARGPRRIWFTYDGRTMRFGRSAFPDSAHTPTPEATP